MTCRGASAIQFLFLPSSLSTHKHSVTAYPDQGMGLEWKLDFWVETPDLQDVSSSGLGITPRTGYLAAWTQVCRAAPGGQHGLKSRQLGSQTENWTKLWSPHCLYLKLKCWHTVYHQLNSSLLFPLEPMIQPPGLLPDSLSQSCKAPAMPVSLKCPSAPSPPVQSLPTLKADCKCHLLHEAWDDFSSQIIIIIIELIIIKLTLIASIYQALAIGRH